MRRLCRVEHLAPGAARGFGPAAGGFTGLFAVHAADAIHVYVNACPHIGAALDRTPGAFLTHDASSIACSNHGALFAIDTGLCTKGPCEGDRLERIPATIADGWILVPEDAGL